MLLGSLVGCSDDTNAPPKGDTAAHRDQAPAGEQGTQVDKSGPTPDKPAAQVDKPPTVPDKGGTPKILSASHPGWAKPNCGSCHSLPPPNHTAKTPPECAKCHGANGACNPNGANSGKKDHNATLNCTSGCHGGSKHGFTVKDECVSCHFANAGLRDCP
jgi:hypothetical protein